MARRRCWLGGFALLPPQHNLLGATGTLQTRGAAGEERSPEWRVDSLTWHLPDEYSLLGGFLLVRALATAATLVPSEARWCSEFFIASGAVVQVGPVLLAPNFLPHAIALRLVLRHLIDPGKHMLAFGARFAGVFLQGGLSGEALFTLVANPILGLGRFLGGLCASSRRAAKALILDQRSGCCLALLCKPFPTLGVCR